MKKSSFLKGAVLAVFVLGLTCLMGRQEVMAAGNTYTITPTSKCLNKEYTDYSTYNDSTKWYYIFRSYLEKIEAEGGGTLKITKGTKTSYTYQISQMLAVPSNTTIDIGSGVTVKKLPKTSGITTTGALFILTSTDALNGKSIYFESEGAENITITGQGTIDMGKYPVSVSVVLGHNSNVTISNLTFKNMGEGHFIEMDASENVTIKNCTFNGGVTKAFANDVNEAINIDTPDKNTAGFGYDFSTQDRTPNKNVVIENCTFKDLQRAIGTHKYSENRYHTNIVVRNNTFSNVLETCINLTNWKDSEISDNTFSNIGEGKDTVYAILVRGGMGNMIMYNSFQKFAATTRMIGFNDATNLNGGSEYAKSLVKVYESSKAALQTNKYDSTVKVNRIYVMGVNGEDFIDLKNTTVAGPRIVTGFTNTDVTDSTIGLSWGAVTGALKYEIFVDDGNGYTKQTETTATGITLRGLTENTSYMVKVRANNGTEGLFSNELSIRTKSVYTPTDVTGLTVASRGTTSLKLKWNPVAGATGYKLYVYNNTSGNYNVYKTLTGTAAASCEVTGLKAFTGYKYMVKAYVTNDGKTYESTNGAILAAGTTADALADVKATPNVNSIRFSWGKQTAATGYDIELYDATAKKYVLLTRIRTSETNAYVYDDLSSATNYKVRIRSYRMINNEKIYTSYQTLETATKPMTQSGLKTKKRAITSVTLQWKKQAGVSGYQIYRYNSKTKKWTLAKTITKASTVQTTISNLDSGSIHKFRIRAYITAGGTKIYGSYGSVLTTNTIPAKTTDLQAVSVRGTKVKLSWLKQTGVTGYEIYKYNSASKKFQKWKTVRKNSYTITLIPNQVNAYKVRAYLKSGKTTFSGEMSDIYRVSLQNITIKSAKKVSGKGFQITWSQCPQMTGYEIQYSTSSTFADKTSKVIKVGKNSTTTKAVKKLAKGKYYIRVRAYNMLNGQKTYSEWTASKTVTIK